MTTINDLLSAVDHWHDELLDQMRRVGNQFDTEWIPPGVRTEIDVTVLDSIALVLDKAGTALEGLLHEKLQLLDQIQMLTRQLHDNGGRRER